MPYAINWGILSGARDAGQAFQEGAALGQQQAQQQRALQRQRTADDALSALARNPDDPTALAAYTAAAPDQAFKWQANRREQATYDRNQRFRGSLSNFMRGGGQGVLQQPDALGSATMPALGGGVLGSMPPAADALAPPPVGDPGDVVVTARRPVPPRPPMAPPSGAGWDAVVAADPVAAMDAAPKIWSDREHQIKDWQAVSQVAMRMLGGVRDQASWDKARTAARDVYEAYGVSFPDLDDDYSPEMVRGLQLQQMDLDKQVDAALAERRFEWQQRDDRIDNARDDRRVGIQDRAARDASARGWSADRRAERRYQRGDGASADDLSSDDLLRIVRGN